MCRWKQTASKFGAAVPSHCLPVNDNLHFSKAFGNASAWQTCRRRWLVATNYCFCNP
jgi:hypothetical protein